TVFVFLLLGQAKAAGPPQPEPPWERDPLYRARTGLVSWWPAGGHALDLAGANHGERSKGVRFEKGRRGLAFSFSGALDETVITRPAALTDPFPLARWALPGSPRVTSREPARYLGGSGQRYAVYPSHGGPEGKRAGCGLSVGTNGVGVFEHTHDNLPAVLAHD